MSLIRAGGPIRDQGRELRRIGPVAFTLVFVAVFAGERDGEERVLVAVE